MLMSSLIILSNTGRRFGNNSSTGTTSPSRLDVLKFQSQMVASASWASRLYWIDLYSRLSLRCCKKNGMLISMTEVMVFDPIEMHTKPCATHKTQYGRAIAGLLIVTWKLSLMV